ncbi:hypothetical protein SASPL_152012 [Salvia splendens]|uniref:Replication protein A 70 kDa DNA-binding subunit B/D first OB fold domain-containing protein n=1 Tax=Salvia splendens TaxID=180675 RepID=A0A8X8W316_SALSN|nr:hypothetical protein SASPL_152012 [Salvia splendens]
MVSFITCVNNLSKTITNSTIKVRCVRAFQGLPEDKNDKSLECVFDDSKGTRIQATFPNTNHQFRLLMNVKTEMVEVNDLRFLREMFDFKPFAEISQYENVDDSSFFGGQRLGGEFDDLQVKSLEDLSYLETCVKKVREVDNKFNRSGCTKTHSYAVKRFKFVVNVVDHTSNASLLLWDREGIQLLGRNVTDFLGNGGQDAHKNSIPALIEEILVGQNVSRKSYVTTDLSTLANENISELFVEGAEFNSGVDAAEGSQKVFVTPDLSLVSNEKTHGWGVEGSVKRCLDLEFDGCDHVVELQMKKKEKIGGEY